jgi:hypothetical protein
VGILLSFLLAGSVAACPKDKPVTNKSTTASAKAVRAREEKCVDRWLAERKLDPYGSPEGTMYAGGTPLFNEATGRQIDRLDYIYRKHPEVKAACAPAKKTRRGGSPTNESR